MKIGMAAILFVSLVFMGTASASLSPLIRFQSGRMYYEQANGSGTTINQYSVTQYNVTQYNTTGGNTTAEVWAVIAAYVYNNTFRMLSEGIPWSDITGEPDFQTGDEKTNTTSEVSVAVNASGVPSTSITGASWITTWTPNISISLFINASGFPYAGLSGAPSIPVITPNSSIGLYVNQSGVPYTYITGHPATATGTAFAAYNRTSATISTTAVSQTNVLSLPLTSGKDVMIECYLSVWSINATNTVRVNITYTGTSSRNTLVEYYTSTTAQALLNSSAASYLVAATTGAGLVSVPMIINGYSVQSSGGFFTVGVQAEIAGSRAAVNRGSWCRSIEIS